MSIKFIIGDPSKISPYHLELIQQDKHVALLIKFGEGDRICIAEFFDSADGKVHLYTERMRKFGLSPKTSEHAT